MTTACVSPRWKRADPWTRGRMPTSARDGTDRDHVATVDALASGRGRSSRTTSYLRSSNSARMSFSCSANFSAPSSVVKVATMASLPALYPSYRAFLSLMSEHSRMPASTIAATRLAISSGSFFGSNGRFSLPTAARIRSISSMMGSAAWRANISASTTSASDASAAPPSTMTTASFEHATMRSMSATASCSNVGNAMRSPLTRATRMPAERARPRDVGDVQRRARAGHGERVGRVDLVRGQHRRDDLRVALVPFGEQRPERPVHDAAGEDLFVPLPPLALEEAARDLTGGEGLLDVLAGEREEVEARAFVAATRP